jgi:hypothetical protein
MGGAISARESDEADLIPLLLSTLRVNKSQVEGRGVLAFGVSQLSHRLGKESKMLSDTESADCRKMRVALSDASDSIQGGCCNPVTNPLRIGGDPSSIGSISFARRWERLEHLIIRMETPNDDPKYQNASFLQQ